MASKNTTVSDGTPERMNISYRQHSNMKVLTKSPTNSYEIILQGHASINWSQT